MPLMRNREEARRHLIEVAEKADAVAGSHINGITFNHDDLYSLSKAIRMVLEPLPRRR